MDFRLNCPIPISEYPVITMAHGSGGRLSHQLIDKMFIPAFSDEQLNAGHDGAVFPAGSGNLAFTTDSFVVKPVPLKHESDWNLASDHSSPVNWKAIAPILTIINDVISARMKSTAPIV